MLGINKEFKPRFLRRYADLDGIMNEAISQYVKDVKSVDFPSVKESY
jgi:3-methyl-2-oxobutanoate hydroxymethyltransferase